MSKISGHVGAAPPGPKQDALPVNHARSVKIRPTVNHRGGAHPAATRALGPSARARAVGNTQRNATKADGRNTQAAVMNQDTAMNTMNPMDQDATPMQPGAFDVGSYGP